MIVVESLAKPEAGTYHPDLQSSRRVNRQELRVLVQMGNYVLPSGLLD
jgi:hypothetical protein